MAGGEREMQRSCVRKSHRYTEERGALVGKGRVVLGSRQIGGGAAWAQRLAPSPESWPAPRAERVGTHFTAPGAAPVSA